MPNAGQPERRYDKGERRYKHVGKGPDPVIEFDSRNPKKWIGKCPSTISEAQRLRLLNGAIPAPNGDRDLVVPKRLYMVYQGAIYEAQTSDGGASYHGYPYKGKLSTSILTALETIARDQECLEAFRDWQKKYIVLYGERQ